MGGHDRKTEGRNPMTVVLRKTVGGIIILTLNRPEKLNAASIELQRQLLAEMQSVAKDPAIRVLILTGAGRAFSAGGDRAILQAMAEGWMPAEARADLTRINSESIRTMLELEIPTLVAVNGFAIGYGAGLTALCDMVVMGRGAFLSDPHVQYGIAATPAAQLIWPRLCSEIVAREILMSGRRVGAEEAQRIGLCNQVCDDGDEVTVAVRMAEAFLALPREGIAATKRAFNAPILAEAGRLGYIES